MNRIPNLNSITFILYTNYGDVTVNVCLNIAPFAEDSAENSGSSDRREQSFVDIEALLDDDEQLDGSDAIDGDSVQGIFNRAVYKRLQLETTGTPGRHEETVVGEKWLLAMLRANDFWVRADQHAELVCKRLSIDFSEPSYYRDIKVWLPNWQWEVEAMPPCVECEESSSDPPGFSFYPTTAEREGRTGL